MRVLTALATMALLGCAPRPTAPLPSPTDGLAARSSRSAYDPATMDLAAVPPVVLALDAWDSHVLAVRTHEAVLALERAADPLDTRPEALMERLRMHALTAQLADNADLETAGFRGVVGGTAVDLHDLRIAQLLELAPGLMELDPGPVVKIRMPKVEPLRQAMRDRPELRDAAALMAELGVPVN